MDNEKSFKDLLNKMIVVVDRNKYMRCIYFILNDKVYMEYNMFANTPWCDFNKILISLGCQKSKISMKNDVANHFKIIINDIYQLPDLMYPYEEKHFKKLNSENIG